MSGCWCPELPRLPHGERVVLLQHPREAKNTLGTARMAHLALPGSQLLVGVAFALEERLAHGRHAVLYPAPDARPLEELPRDTTLWVIDGTWAQARAMWRSNPALHRLPAYALPLGAPSEYQIRHQPAVHCLSTVEALARALDLVHGGDHAAMLAPFRALVQRQLAHVGTPRMRTRPRISLPPRLLEPVLRAPERAVIVHAEVNGWPGVMPRPPAELVQWLALRPATGERLDLTLDSALSPTMAGHLELDDAAPRVSRAELERRWRDFSRDDDVWLTWGHGPLNHGFAPTRVVDLRLVTANKLGARPGRIEDACRQLAAGATTPLGSGRGGRRLALMAGLAERLTRA